MPAAISLSALVEPAAFGGMSVEIATPVTLAAVIDAMGIGSDTHAAWRELRPTILGIAAQFGAKNLLEIGGGRFPFLTPAEVAELGATLSVNDISAAELARAPASFAKSCFDVAGELPPARLSSYDLVFSRMVLEHVRDARRAWTNTAALLRPGGIGFAFVPTLYSLPFVANCLLPEGISRRLVRNLDGDRVDDNEPKFPAFYRLCRARQKAVEPELLRAGFREVVVVPFFGTPYFPAIPVLRHVMRAFDLVIEAVDARQFASYAYIVARK